MSGFSADWLALRQLLDQRAQFGKCVTAGAVKTLQVAFMLQSLGLIWQFMGQNFVESNFQLLRRHCRSP